MGKKGFQENPPVESLWNSLTTVSDLQREEEKTTPNSLGVCGTAESKALWKQRQSKQNQIAHQATEFLKAQGLTWNGYRKKKIPGLDF
jgi:hypothetical protein